MPSWEAGLISLLIPSDSPLPHRRRTAEANVLVVFNALGCIELNAPSGPADRIVAQPLRLALFSWLALAAPRGQHRRDLLLPLFWPEADERHARNSLSQALHHLRRELPHELVVSRGTATVGLQHPRLRCDVHLLEQAVRTGDWLSVRQLYRGQLLPGLHVDGATEFERWLEGERRRVQGLALEAGWRAAEAAARGGDAQTAIESARWAADLVPYDEAALRRLMTLLLGLGDRAGAAAALDRFAQRMRSEFDEEPSPETRALLQRHDPVRAPVARPARPAVSDRPVDPPVPLLAAPASRPRRRWALGAPLAVAAVLSVVAAASQAHWRTPAPTGVVAVLPLASHGEPDLDRVADGITVLLEGKLDRAGGVRVADPRAVRALARADDGNPDGSGALRAAQGVRATWLVTGDVTAAGALVQVRADLRRADRPDSVVASSVASGSRDALFALADSLAIELLGDGLGIGRRQLLAAARVATASLPAFRAFLDGERAMREGRYGLAVDRFREAVSLDSGFAIAAYRGAAALDWAGWSAAEVQAMLALAQRGQARLPDRRRRLLQAATDYYGQRGDSAERALRALVADDPADVEAWYLLGETIFHLGPALGRSRLESREPFERVAALDPDDPETLVHLARLAAADRDLPRLRALVERVDAVLGNTVRGWELRGLLAYASGDPARQRQFDRDLAAAPPGAAPEVARAIAAYLEDPRAAERVARASAEVRAAPRDAEYALAQGHWSATWDVLAGECKVFRDACALRRLWLASLPGAVLSPAQAEEFRAAVATASLEVFGEHRHYAEAVRALTLGRFDAVRGDSAGVARALASLGPKLRGPSAVAVLRAAFRSVVVAEWISRHGDRAGAADTVAAILRDPSRRAALLGPDVAWPLRLAAADLLAAGGREDEALRLYRSVPDASARDLMYLPFAHLGTARILSRRHEVGARDCYATVLRLWADPDAAFRPFVDAIRREAAAVAG